MILFRPKLDEFDYTSHGQDTVTAIYRGVGNSEVRQMVQQYFPEMCTLSVSLCRPWNNQVQHTMGEQQSGDTWLDRVRNSS